MKKLPHDPRFDFVDYRHTNLEVTFRRVRRRMAEEAEAAEKAQREAAANKITPINRQQKGK